MTVKTHTFRGRKYAVVNDERLHGYCTGPHHKRPHIFINPDLSPKLLMEVVIHESLHACKWGATETDVDETARDLTRLLWRLGYRLEKA